VSPGFKYTRSCLYCEVSPRPKGKLCCSRVGYLVPRSLLDLLRAPDVAGADPRLFASFTLTQGLTMALVPPLVGLLVWMSRSRPVRATPQPQR
jgi:hypothetical protein